MKEKTPPGHVLKSTSHKQIGFHHAYNLIPLNIFYTFHAFTKIEWTLLEAQMKYAEVIYVTPQTRLMWLQLCVPKVYLHVVSFCGIFVTDSSLTVIKIMVAGG